MQQKNFIKNAFNPFLNSAWTKCRTSGLGLEKNIFMFVQRIKQEHREKQNKQTFEI